MMAASEEAAGGENAYIPVRVRWFDDLTASVAPTMRQVVVLGAGLDTRPYRLDVPAELDWYEVDRPDVFAAKQQVMADHVPRCRRQVVEGDLAADWGSALVGAGIGRDAPTLWLAEGLFFYLTADMIAGMLRDAAALCGPGSVFAADVTGTAGLDSPVMARYRAWCADNDVPPPFGTDDPIALFEAGGWRIEHVTAPGAPDANYGRLAAQRDGVVPGRTHLVVGRR